MTGHHDLWAGDLLPQLIARRRQLGLTQDELGHRIGVTDALVGKYEARMRAPGAFLLACWVEALDARLVLEPRTGLVQALKPGTRP